MIDNETLTQNYTLTKRSFAGIDNIPYIFDRYNVGTSAVLTIEPGVILKFRQNGYMDVRNGLIADGGPHPTVPLCLPPTGTISMEATPMAMEMRMWRTTSGGGGSTFSESRSMPPAT
jgi:hypothetical protein